MFTDVLAEGEELTLNYPECDISVIIRGVSPAIEIDIESYDIFFGPHMVEISGTWALELGLKRTIHTGTVIEDKTLRFSNINSADANELLSLIDTIIKINQQRVIMVDEFMDQFSASLDCEFEDESSSLHMHAPNGNVSIYNISDLVLVYIQSDEDLHAFEPFLSPEFGPINETDTNSYVFSYEGQNFPGAEYIENGVYQFCFNYPRDEHQIRMLLPMAVKIIGTEE